MNRDQSAAHFFPTILLIFSIVLFHNGTGWCSNYYVEPDGTGTTCSRLVPCDFTYAIDTKASAGDHIFFKEGIYKRTASSVLRLSRNSTYTEAGTAFLLGTWSSTPSFIHPSWTGRVFDRL